MADAVKSFDGSTDSSAVGLDLTETFRKPVENLKICADSLERITEETNSTHRETMAKFRKTEQLSDPDGVYCFLLLKLIIGLDDDDADQIAAKLEASKDPEKFAQMLQGEKEKLLIGLDNDDADQLASKLEAANDPEAFAQLVQREREKLLVRLEDDAAAAYEFAVKLEAANDPEAFHQLFQSEKAKATGI